MQDGETLLYHSQIHGNYVVKRLLLLEDCQNHTDVWEHFMCVTHRTDDDLARGLAAVTRNLRRWFAVVGTLERFDEFIVLQHFAFNEPWEPCVVESNVHKDLYAGLNFTDWQFRLLAEYNKYDLVLYEAVSQLFEEQVQHGLQDPRIRPYLLKAQAGEL